MIGKHISASFTSKPSAQIGKFETLSNRIPRFVEAELKNRGYQVRRTYLSYHFAGVHGIRIKDGRWDGGADPGRDGMVMEV